MGLDLSLLNLLAENFFFYVVMFVVTLAIVIILHEFGHYLAARVCGVHVQQFAMGFGPEIVGFGDSNPKEGRYQTRWSLCLFPIGGYVKLFGDVDRDNPVVWDKDDHCARRLSEEELNHAFCTKSVWKRIFIVFAGPAINILFTLVLLVSLYTFHGQSSQPVIINAVKVGSSAETAGIQIGDEILKMDGVSIRRLGDIYDITKAENPPQPHTYLINRDGRRLEITHTAAYVTYEDKKGVERQHGQTGMVRINAIKFEDVESFNGLDTINKPELARQFLTENMDQKIVLGLRIRSTSNRLDQDYFNVIIPSEHNDHLSNPDHKLYNQVQLVDKNSSFFVRLPFLEAVQETGQFFVNSLVNSYKLMAALSQGKNEERVLGGVGTISKKTAEATQAGFYSYIVFIAVLSYMIGLINLLPIPVFDGGYLLFLFYEVVSGKPVSQKVQNIAIIFGLVFLLGIMIIANVGDVLLLFDSE